MSPPTVSVVMPAYNHERFVGEAVESVLGQSFSDLELVIVDDGSTDATAEVIRSYKDTRIRYHYQENQDAYNALNRGMSLAEGAFVAIINSDDVYELNRLERLLSVQADTNAQCLFSEIALIGDNSEIIDDPEFWWRKWHENNRSYYFKYNDLYAAFLHANIMVTTSNLFLTRAAAETVGEFSSLRYLHDYDFIFRILAQYPQGVTYLHDEKLLRYRLHGSNTISEAAIVGREQDRMIIRKYLLQKCPTELHAYLNIGIDRLIALEHELIEVKAEIAAQKTLQESLPEKKPPPEKLVSRVLRHARQPSQTLKKIINEVRR